MAKFNTVVIDRCQIAAGVNDPGGKFVTGTAGVVDAGGKFATNVNDTGGELLPVSISPTVNLPLVSNDTGSKK